MASSVAKLKPLPSMAPEPDEVAVQSMEENEVLAGLARSGDSTRKADILGDLRANARRNGGRLQFGDRHALFRVLRGALCDSNSNTRLRCLEFVCEIIPEFGDDLDNCMSFILPQLVSNLGDSQVSVKKSAIQTLHMYMKHSSQVGKVLNAIIAHGLESDDRKTRTESLVALPILIMPNLAHQDLFTLTKALVVRLEISARPESSPAVISLERIKNVVGSATFDNYLRLLTPEQKDLCLVALENHGIDSTQDTDVLGIRKAKSAGHLNSNGVVLDEKDNVLHRAHTISGNKMNAMDDGLDGLYGPLEFGFVPASVMAKLRDHTNWRIRAQGIEELKTLMVHLNDMAPVLPRLGALFGMLLDFLDDVNFKIGSTSLQIIGLLVAKLGVSVKPFLKPLLGSLGSKLGDNKIVIRQENMKVLMQLMQILTPLEVLSVLTANLQHRNSRVREETVNVVTAALLTFPSSDFDLPGLSHAIAPALVDSKRRVRQAALEAFAVIAQAMGAGRFQPVIAAVDAIELSMGGDGVMAAITSRLTRRQLPRLNRDGLVEYAVPLPSSGTMRGQTNLPRGPDIDWILAGTAGTGSADLSGSARSTPGFNDSLNLSGHSPRRILSAGKNLLPWEGAQSRDVSQVTSNGVEAKPPPMKVNSWAPAEIINDRAVKSTPQSRVSSLVTSTKAKTTSSYVEKYLAKTVQRANQVIDQVADSSPGSSYVEMHRTKAKKDKGKISGHTVPGIRSTADSYALLYKRGTINPKAKTTGGAEPIAGEQSAKESAPRGLHSTTPAAFALHSSFSPGDDELLPPSLRKAFPMSLSSSWPDWTEVTSQARPWGRLSPVSHTLQSDLDTTGENLDSERRKSDVPPAAIHVKPQLARSASKSRGLRAPEFAELWKVDSQPAGIDFLDFTPSRPTHLAPVNPGNQPPQDSLRQVHKQADTKRALKMYSVITDSDDGGTRTPSPDPPAALHENTTRTGKGLSMEESPFDSKPRIVRTPLHSRRHSAETALQSQSASPLSNRLPEPEVSGLGVAGYGLLASRGGSAGVLSPLPNGPHDGGNKQSKTSDVRSNVSMFEEDQVEFVGHARVRSEPQERASQENEGGNPLEYETEDSDDSLEDGDEEEEDAEEEEEDEEEEEEVEDEKDADEEDEQDSDLDSEEASDGEELTQPSDTQAEQVESHEIESRAFATTERAPLKEQESLGSSEDSGEGGDPAIRGVSENRGDMTPRTVRKSLSKSTRERMERRRLEEEQKIQKEQQRLEELEKERTRQRQLQREEEERLRQKITKERLELIKMFDRKEKEREAEKQKQRQLQEELQKQEKALRERLLKQQEELEGIEQEKQREKEQRQKERMREKMRQKQKQKQQEAEQREREQEEAIRRKLAEKEAELQKEQAGRLKEAAAESEDLSVTGSGTALKPSGNRKPPLGSSPKKKTPVSSAQSEREAGYAATDDPQEQRRHYAASAGTTSSQCWEVGLDDLQPFGNPDSALREALKYLANTEDWEMKCEGIQGVRRLSKHHTETVASQIQGVTRAIVAEVKNLRSQVSRSAICCLGDMYLCLGKHMDGELDVTAKILLSKAGESSGFIRDDVDKSLTAMVNSLNPARVIAALVSGGASHRNVTVRKTTAQFLSFLAERMGANRVLSGAKDVTEKMLTAAAHFLTDGGPETRYYGRKILYTVCDHHEFDKLVSKHLPDNLQKTVRDTVENLRTKGLGDPPSDLSSSARQRKPASGSGSLRSGGVRGSVTMPSSSTSSRESSRSSKSATRNGLVQGQDIIPNLINLLQANDWKERLQAIDQFVDLVQLNPDGLGQKFTKAFDAFLPRLQDSNSKVNLHALHCLPKILPCLVNQSSSFVPPVVSVVASNLASKNTNIFAKAEEAIDELIKSTDNCVLVQPFCTSAQYGTSRVKPLMVDRLADIVPTVWPRKPQAVSRHVLPVLWNLLGSTSNGSAGPNNSAIKTSVHRLTSALHSCMGTKTLVDHTSGQLPRVQEKLHEIIGSQHY